MGIPLSSLPVAAALTGAEELVLVQSVVDKLVTVDALGLFIGAEGVGTSTANLDTLANLEDVLLTSPADGDVLTYDAATGLWVNLPAAGGGGQGTSTVLQLDDIVSIFDFTVGYAFQNIGGDETAFTGNIPAAGSLGGLANLGEKVEAWFSGQIVAAGSQIKVYVGGILAATSGTLGITPTAAFLVTVTIIRFTATDVKTIVQFCVNGLSCLVGYNSIAVTFSSPIPVAIKLAGGTIPAAADITLQAAAGKWIPRA